MGNMTSIMNEVNDLDYSVERDAVKGPLGDWRCYRHWMK